MKSPESLDALRQNILCGNDQFNAETLIALTVKH